MSAAVQVISGVPQGSVLGPLLFLVYTADLKFSINSHFAMYADDLKIYNESCNQLIMTNDISAVLKWSEQWALPLHRDKCTILYLGSKNCKHTYRMGGAELKKLESYIFRFRYLGNV